MAVYSFYIFDRHTECVYTRSWLAPSQAALPISTTTTTTTAPSTGSTTTTNNPNDNNAAATNTANTTGAVGVAGSNNPKLSTRAQNDAKLIFGTVFSLRNIVRKLGGEDDAFISFRTGQYRLHYYETPTNLRFVLLTDTATLSMRNVLHQVYINLWVEYVVKNPLAPVEHKGGEGVKNELFELGLDQFIRGLQ